MRARLRFLQMHGGACGGAQHETIRKMSLCPNVTQPGALGQLQQLVPLKTPKYRQRPVMSQQAIVQNQLAERRVKQIRDRMPVKIDNENPSPCDPTHLTKNLDHLLINK